MSHEHIVSVVQIPDDPFAMPPPYWRSGGAIFQLLDAFEDMLSLLIALLPVHQDVESQIESFFKRHPNEPSDEEEQYHEEFAEIIEPLVDVEHKVRLKAELVILMAAIEVEDRMNQFSVFNLHKDVAESIEKSTTSEKLLILSNYVGASDAKGSVAFEATKKLSGWRNAYAHGHCIDRPTKSLRHNHLVPPGQYPELPDALKLVKEMIFAYFKVVEHLSVISKNPYTAGTRAEDDEIRDFLISLAKFKVTPRGSASSVYDIVEV